MHARTIGLASCGNATTIATDSAARLKTARVWFHFFDSVDGNPIHTMALWVPPHKHPRTLHVENGYAENANGRIFRSASSLIGFRFQPNSIMRELIDSLSAALHSTIAFQTVASLCLEAVHIRRQTLPSIDSERNWDISGNFMMPKLILRVCGKRILR